MLRRPESIPPRFVSFAWRYRDGGRCFAPPGYGRFGLEAWTFDLPEPTRDWIAEISGFSQVPGQTPLCTCPGRVPRGTLGARPIQRRGCCLPRVPQRRLPDARSLEAGYHGLHTRCLRFATTGYPATTQDSLPVGGHPCRVGFGPTGSATKGFRINSLHPSPLPRLRLARGTSPTEGMPCREGMPDRGRPRPSPFLLFPIHRGWPPRRKWRMKRQALRGDVPPSPWPAGVSWTGWGRLYTRKRTANRILRVWR